MNYVCFDIEMKKNWYYLDYWEMLKYNFLFILNDKEIIYYKGVILLWKIFCICMNVYFKEYDLYYIVI